MDSFELKSACFSTLECVRQDERIWPWPIGLRQKLNYGRHFKKLVSRFQQEELCWTICRSFWSVEVGGDLDTENVVVRLRCIRVSGSVEYTVYGV